MTDQTFAADPFGSAAGFTATQTDAAAAPLSGGTPLGGITGGLVSGAAGHSEEAERAFVEYLVKAIVDEPNEVSVTRTVDDLGVLITLKVGKNDMGKIIGKSGQTAKALRTLIRVFGSKSSNRVNLKILEPETV